MSHRPMCSSRLSPYQLFMRKASEELFREDFVDSYFAGHIHYDTVANAIH